ncbi:hypothetical protein EYF80_003714 [Liparis tanakae]|uniref:Uncharacterized protein n=1 Tax=Liparis tanakae TaxID=230148 RepID=A0A4Z2J6V2_9TELE|nr:hypothetical protein EYF80_003714 [Liparis tanakae]
MCFKPSRVVSYESGVLRFCTLTASHDAKRALDITAEAADVSVLPKLQFFVKKGWARALAAEMRVLGLNAKHCCRLCSSWVQGLSGPQLTEYEMGLSLGQSSLLGNPITLKHTQQTTEQQRREREREKERERERETETLSCYPLRGLASPRTAYLKRKSSAKMQPALHMSTVDM